MALSKQVERLVGNLRDTWNKHLEPIQLGAKKMLSLPRLKGIDTFTGKRVPKEVMRCTDGIAELLVACGYLPEGCVGIGIIETDGANDQNIHVDSTVDVTAHYVYLSGQGRWSTTMAWTGNGFASRELACGRCWSVETWIAHFGAKLVATGNGRAVQYSAYATTNNPFPPTDAESTLPFVNDRTVTEQVECWERVTEKYLQGKGHGATVQVQDKLKLNSGIEDPSAARVLLKKILTEADGVKAPTRTRRGPMKEETDNALRIILDKYDEVREVACSPTTAARPGRNKAKNAKKQKRSASTQSEAATDKHQYVSARDAISAANTSVSVPGCPGVRVDWSSVPKESCSPGLFLTRELVLEVLHKKGGHGSIADCPEDHGCIVDCPLEGYRVLTMPTRLADVISNELTKLPCGLNILKKDGDERTYLAFNPTKPNMLNEVAFLPTGAGGAHHFCGGVTSTPYIEIKSDDQGTETCSSIRLETTSEDLAFALGFAVGRGRSLIEVHDLTHGIHHDRLHEEAKVSTDHDRVGMVATNVCRKTKLGATGLWMLPIAAAFAFAKSTERASRDCIFCQNMWYNGKPSLMCGKLVYAVDTVLSELTTDLPSPSTEPVSLMNTNTLGCSGDQQKIRTKLTKTVQRNEPLIVFGRTESGEYIAALWLQGTEPAKMTDAWTFTPTYEGHHDLKKVTRDGTDRPYTLDDIWVQHAATFKNTPAPKDCPTKKKRLGESVHNKRSKKKKRKTKSA